jgi:hypothetical protein
VRSPFEDQREEASASRSEISREGPPAGAEVSSSIDEPAFPPRPGITLAGVRSGGGAEPRAAARTARLPGQSFAHSPPQSLSMPDPAPRVARSSPVMAASARAAQPLTARALQIAELRGKLRQARHGIGVMHPEAFQALERDDHLFEVCRSHRRLFQHFEVPSVHRAEPVA